MYKPERETEILSFWKENNIFKKSLEQTKDGEPYVFYDGPPFATGLPHVGHVLPSTMKDVIPRYQTMKGRYVSRKWGWDCHGLPVENLIEKELGLNTKKDILELGIGKFNKAARESVLRYADQWRELVPRFGRWVDMDDDYRTMDASYTSGVWDIFSTLNKKGLVYESFKVMYVCPRCETSLSNFEVNQSYKDITDISVYVKFELIGDDAASLRPASEESVFLLAWTTTPWTLPGNMALAIGKEMEYVKVKVIDENNGNDQYLILAKSRLEHALKMQDYEILGDVSAADLVGKSYLPVFDTYRDADLPNKEKAWKVYAADFVTDTDGSGVVHIAPGFGDDDMKLAQAEGIPFVQHVAMNGVIKPEVKEFAGLQAKPKSEEKDGQQATDVEIIKYLAKHHALFSKEKIVHSYPHCWRCSTPLLNYATTSWFVKVADSKDRLVEENSKVHWVPKEIGANRFGNWLEAARDWNVSRSRFWGAPLPVWKSEDGKTVEFIGSIEELSQKLKRNNYFVMRHGEAEHNVKMMLDSSRDSVSRLTETGAVQVRDQASKLKKVDVIYASPLLRTKETADIVKEATGFAGEIVFDDRLREFELGSFNGGLWEDFNAYANEHRTNAWFDFVVPEGEGYKSVRDRVSDFLYDIDTKHEGQNILVITHEALVKMCDVVARGGTEEDLRDVWHEKTVHTGDIFELNFSALPKNENNELDLHRPYIDEVILSSANEKGEKVTLHRVPDVFDCWFESGSMPYTSNQAGFPAEFIAEGLDQTRGWFYSLMVLGVRLRDVSPYRNVVVNGLILAEDGKKMSKSLNNYPPLAPLLEKYGADSLRYFFLSSPSVKAEDTAFSEKSLDEVIKKHFNRLYNVISLYEMYKDDANNLSVVSDHVLDVWITTLLQKTAATMTTHLDRYEFDKATKPIGDFIEDLSIWYIRRSRDRFKSEDAEDRDKALSTTRYILIELSKLMAPFLPFLAEDVYGRIAGDAFLVDDPAVETVVQGTQKKESVHLESWPTYEMSDDAELVLARMEEVRKIVSLALEARSKENIKVRQPLSRLMLRTDEKDIADDATYVALIKDEVNVEEVILNSAIEDDVALDVTLTPELVKKGVMREFMRAIQDLRKRSDLSPKDSIVLTIETNEEGKELVRASQEELMRTAKIADILFEEVAEGETLSLEGYPFKVMIKKL
jgi:isoleucyl-tRNA synthetase